MKNSTAGLLLSLAVLLAGPVLAQDASKCVPSPTNMPNAGYPRVCPDNRVMFKLEAPQARRVQLQPNPGASDNGLGKGPFDMAKGADGVWSLTLGPVRSGFHDYHFLVDGLPVNDPGSNTYTVSLGLQSTWGLNRATSGFEVPEKGVDFYLPKDVPHGEVEELWYKAKSTGEYRRAFVYVPPGYDKSLTTRFPVLYLQHGGTNDETSWVKEGHVSFIMDNLLAEKKIVPMLVVMERGYATMAQTSAQQTVPFNPDLFRAFDKKGVLAKVWVKDLVPTIDARYRTIPDSSHRALAGLSMGAGQAMTIGLTNLDTYGSIGSFSGGGSAHTYFADPKAYANGVLTDAKSAAGLKDKLKLLWIGGGTAEAGYKDIVKFHQTLDKLGVKHAYYEAPGTAHEWATWRRHLYDFAPRLFRDSK